MCMIDGGDTPTVYRSRTGRAAKPHRCDECSRVIAAGETYTSATMLYEGYWDTFRACAHCRVAQLWLRENCGGFLHHGVWEDVEEHVSEYPDIAFDPGRTRRDRDALMPVPRMPRPIAYAMERMEARAVRARRLRRMKMTFDATAPAMWADDGGPHPDEELLP